MMHTSLVYLGVICCAASIIKCNNDFSGSGEMEQTPPVYETAEMQYGNLTCELYVSGGLCAAVLPPIPVLTNWSTGTQMEVKEDLNSIFYIMANNLMSSSQCVTRAVPMLCIFTFPYCDPAYMPGDVVYQPLCQWDCEVMRDFVCPQEWEQMIQLGELLDFKRITTFDCNLLEPSNGGDTPLCISTLDGGPIPAPLSTGNCYSGKGRGYNGTIDITESGQICQLWSENYPHQYYLFPEQYPELIGDHNYCRNPGEKGERPWCFTINRTIRWEYCDVPHCDMGPICERYTGSLCRTTGSIGMDYIFFNTSLGNQNDYEMALMKVLESLPNYPNCDIMLMSELLCHVNFPLCDLSNERPRPRKVCNSYCKSVMENCGEFYTAINNFFVDYNPLVIPECNNYDSSETVAGDNPECYMPISIDNIITNGTGDCYDLDTKGTDYNGTFNVTESGKSCQYWDSNVPHTHPISSLFRRYLEGHNYCRNPDGRGEKPWCYTTDVNQRWEYCNISICSSATSTTSTTSTSSTNRYIIPVSASAGGLFLILLICTVIVFVCCVKRSHTKTKSVILNTDKDLNPDIKQHQAYPNPLYSKKCEFKNTDEYDEYQDTPLPQYDREKLVYICDLGEGHFGTVIRAEALQILPDEDKSTVAVKVLKEGASVSAKKEFYREASLMSGFNHPNILKLLGVCIEQNPLCMIFEYMDNGDMNSFLRQNAPAHTLSFPRAGPKTLSQPLSIKLLVDMCIHIAAGLDYLANHHYIHRDLATRNCLIDYALTVKISDFGLSQDIYVSDYFRLGESELLPVRWMPPEAILISKFSVQSDIWSFGVVLWEIFSYGIQPYYGMSNEEVVQYVKEERVLKCPERCPQEIYDLMIDCWNLDPDERPKARELYTGLKRWTPEMSASIQVQAKHPDYQNMSTILEWARRSIDGSVKQSTGDHPYMSLDPPGIPSPEGKQDPYDHLHPSASPYEKLPAN